MAQRSSALQFDLADQRDLDEIRRINHRTFAEEIPQHRSNPNGRLVDRYEAESLFIVARDADEIVGMIALREARPFSLDAKLTNLDQYLPPGRRACEVRLLSVEPSRRQGIVLRGLLERLVRECDARGLDLAVMSATTRQLGLYRHLGCVPFADPVGTRDAAFQPMYVTRESLVEHVGTLIGTPAHCFMTGPVSLSESVRARLRAPLQSHRSPDFASDLSAIREGLAGMIRARQVAVFAGSGTLANDAVAAQLRARGERGLVLSNGEFGDRLIAHAVQHGLAHAVLRRPWGTSIDRETIAHAMRRSNAAWIWAVHCETSTGMLNDLDVLRELSAAHGAVLAIDAASSVGTIPLDLDGVALASTVSGKALGAVAGLAIVCCAEPPRPVTRGTPSYLDLARYTGHDGVPFTQSSLLVGALAEAITGTDWKRRYAETQRAGATIRERLLRHDIRPLVASRHASPAVATWVVADGRPSEDVGRALESRGFRLSWQSGYLRERGWIQSAFFGQFAESAVPTMAEALAGQLRDRRTEPRATSQAAGA